MRSRRRRTAVLAVAVLAAVCCTTATAPPAAAQTTTPGLAITAPTSASLGSTSVGAKTLTADLGPVKVTTGTASLGTGSWTASVSTTGFTTGARTAAETIAPAAVGYRSGLATASSGLSLSACTPGQPVTAVSLSSARTAFSCSGFSLLTATSLTWNPQISVTLTNQNVVGTYSGTIVHSVA